MSRTYRRLKLKKPIKRLNLNNILIYYPYLNPNSKYFIKIKSLIENSKQLKKEIALDFCDGTNAIWNVKGPHHFHNIKERIHRSECRDSIQNYVRTYNTYKNFKNNKTEYTAGEYFFNGEHIDNEEMFISLFFPELDDAEPVLRSKPTREYWF